MGFAIMLDLFLSDLTHVLIFLNMLSYRLYCFGVYLITGEKSIEGEKNNGLAWVVNESRNLWMA